MPPDEEVHFAFLLKRADLCHLGFWLGLGAYFLPCDTRLRPLGEAILSAQFEDGGWNCHMRNYPERRHSSFNTTFNVLENLRIAAEHGVVTYRAFQEAEARAVEFMLAHRLFRSDKTGEVIGERFTHLTYPWHWHYKVLRGLDYLRLTPAIHDERLDDPIQLVLERRKPNGRWPLQKRIPGQLLVEMEKPGGESRWNRFVRFVCCAGGRCDVMTVSALRASQDCLRDPTRRQSARHGMSSASRTRHAHVSERSDRPVDIVDIHEEVETRPVSHALTDHPLRRGLVDDPQVRRITPEAHTLRFAVGRELVLLLEAEPFVEADRRVHIARIDHRQRIRHRDDPKRRETATLSSWCAEFSLLCSRWDRSWSPSTGRAPRTTS